MILTVIREIITVKAFPDIPVDITDRACNSTLSLQIRMFDVRQETSLEI